MSLIISEIEKYNSFLVDIKTQIKLSQQKAFNAVNQEMISLYFNIGKMIDTWQKELGWGAKVIDKLSLDILNEFPTMSGFSTRNLKLMVQFYKEYSNDEFVQPIVAQIPWTHNIILIQKIKDKNIRFWYMEQTLQNGWSKDILSLMIKSEVHNRTGNLVSNFSQILPPLESDLVQQSFKDPYRFDFLTITEPFRERELENNLIKHMEKFLIELGSGFAFVGRQYKLEIGDDEFYIDLLFYHLKLRCFIVVELKKGKFKPEYSGQVNFYCSAIDGILAQKDDKPTIGLILCQEKNEIVAEYSLRNMTQPIGISEYQLTEVLPKEFESSLPTIEEIEQELKQICSN
ncbi:PDDEXK nuclease domain-containing protein [Aliarcobacter butzleri]|uniref:PDDEXK nuclease domain-containing protein n=1 Tax=Aliarcobacter TaxID=2321111 RepID=UPI00112F313E|nr:MULTISPECIES: PDDEXK nuclease domain-containing protein [Aliarcobacter]MDS1371440.1 PDDEXK nuclease domain-containing protein [Aliarcobacter butzleri]